MKLFKRKEDDINEILDELGVTIRRTIMPGSGYTIYGEVIRIIHKKRNYLHHQERRDYNLERAKKYGVGNWKDGHLK